MEQIKHKTANEVENPPPRSSLGSMWGYIMFFQKLAREREREMSFYTCIERETSFNTSFNMRLSIHVLRERWLSRERGVFQEREMSFKRERCLSREVEGEMSFNT